MVYALNYIIQIKRPHSGGNLLNAKVAPNRTPFFTTFKFEDNCVCVPVCSIVNKFWKMKSTTWFSFTFNWTEMFTLDLVFYKIMSAYLKNRESQFSIGAGTRRDSLNSWRLRVSESLKKINLFTCFNHFIKVQNISAGILKVWGCIAILGNEKLAFEVTIPGRADIKDLHEH